MEMYSGCLGANPLVISPYNADIVVYKSLRPKGHSLNNMLA